MAHRLPLTALALALTATAVLAGAPDRAQAAASHVLSQRQALGLNGLHDFQMVNANTDQLGMTHARFQQTFQGVKVFGGEIITHMDAAGSHRAMTLAHQPVVALNTTPGLQASEALALAHQILAPKGGYAYAPKVELVIVPETETIAVRPTRRALDMTFDTTTSREQVVRYTLAYHVHTELENGTEETAHTDFLINAHTGAVIDRWSTLHTAGATGTGNSQFSGNVALQTNSTASGYEMRDMTRGTAGNYTTNLNHATSGVGTIYTDTDNAWGDGANYVEGSSTTAANGQTAAVDAHYGLGVTWDMYKNVFGRNGIDGVGTTTYSRVHYSNSYDNAFWSDSCFCMTYGDGNSFLTLTALDVAGHEMTHGVTSRTANLTYRGESGGLNESMSDIFGTMAEFYRGSTGTTIPATGGNFTIGEQLQTPAYNHPLRYMYKPSLDGSSKDAWSTSLKRLDVHYSSGPMNRCFYFMSQGASSTSTSNFYSSYLPGGMTGIGNDKAARIVFRALTTYMTSSTVYAGARTACLSAATDLYGAGSAEYTAVANAFKAINVN
ncbi:MAG TPA: M4 family metallopeptidase [Holophagaceae bacterium]|nr:M4 family metallopeptidase [Holophagaceae bacterium]